MSDPGPNILKSAAAYLVELARSSKGGRYRKSAKIEALSAPSIRSRLKNAIESFCGQ